MALPPQRLPPRGPRAPPAPQLLQAFVLPETFYPQGAANLCQLPGQEQPFPAAWAPPVGVAPHAPQAPPAGLQRAPCGCFFDPRVFHFQWTSTNLPPPATATLGHGAASLPAAALWGYGICGTPLAWAAPGTPQGQWQHFAPYNHQGRGVAPAPPVLLTSIPSYQHIEGQPAWINIPGTATTAGTAPGSNIPPGSDAHPGPSAAPDNQGIGNPASDLAVSEEVLLKEALRLFGCSPDTVGVSQDGASSVPMPGDPDGTGREGRAVAPAPPVLPMSVPDYQRIEGQYAWIDIPGTATPAGTPPGSNIPPGSGTHPSPSAAPHNQALGDAAADLPVSQEVPLEEALRLFGCSLDTVGVSQDSPSSVPMPGDPGGTGAAIPHRDFALLALPEELLTPDYSVPEISDTILSLEESNTIRMEPQEL